MLNAKLIKIFISWSCGANFGKHTWTSFMSM